MFRPARAGLASALGTTAGTHWRVGAMAAVARFVATALRSAEARHWGRAQPRRHPVKYPPRSGLLVAGRSNLAPRATTPRVDAA